MCIWINDKEKITIKIEKKYIESEIEKKFLILTLAVFEIFNELINEEYDGIELEINEKKIENFDIDNIIKNYNKNIKIRMYIIQKNLSTDDLMIWLESDKYEEGYLLYLEEKRKKIN